MAATFCRLTRHHYVAAAMVSILQMCGVTLGQSRSAGAQSQDADQRVTPEFRRLLARYESANLYAREPVQFSPDDSKLCFASPATGNGDIYVTDLKAGGCRRLTNTDDVELDPVFSPDGNWVAYSRSTSTDLVYPKGIAHVWVADLGTGKYHQVTNGTVLDRWVDGFDATSRRILFQRDVSKSPFAVDPAPFTVNIDGTGLKTGLPVGRPAIPGATSVGDVSVFAMRGNPPDQEHLHEIYIKRGKNGEPEFLTKGQFPFLSLDGKWVIYDTEAFSVTPVEAIHIETKEKRLVLPSGPKSVRAISHDGKTLAVAMLKHVRYEDKEIDFAVYLVDLDDLSVRRLECGAIGPGA